MSQAPCGIFRRELYKVGVDHREARRKREDELLEIRKNKREENLQKRRREGVTSSSYSSVHAALRCDGVKRELDPNVVRDIMSQDFNAQQDAARRLRKTLSMECDPPIGIVVDAGLVPRLVEFLQRVDAPQLQFEAAWCLTNIASGTSQHTKIVIDHGTIPIFLELLKSPSEDVREQAVWALGNIAGDCPEYRDLVLSHGAMEQLLTQYTDSTALNLLRNATWTLANFCRGKPSPPFDQVKAAIPVLAKLIQMDDDDILIDACWSLSHLSDGPNDKIQAVIEAGVCPRLVELLHWPSQCIVIPALRTVGNIVTGDDAQTQAVIDSNVLPSLLFLITGMYKKNIKREAMWTISNITAGNKSQIQAVIDANIFPSLLCLLAHGEFDVKKEAAWALSNATSGGSQEQIRYLVHQGCIKPLCNLLTSLDSKIVSVCLEGLYNILKVGEMDKARGLTGGVNRFAQFVEEADGVDKIESLQRHGNAEVYVRAVKILEAYLTEVDNGDKIQPMADESQHHSSLPADWPPCASTSSCLQ